PGCKRRKSRILLSDVLDKSTTFAAMEKYSWKKYIVFVVLHIYIYIYIYIFYVNLFCMIKLRFIL
ncbi:hypothetical protein ACMBCM_04295, partial [Spiroplasma sp. K1]